MIRAVLADSGPLYAVADEGDEYHRLALRQWQELDRVGLSIVVPYPVLLEAHRLGTAWEPKLPWSGWSRRWMPR